MIEVVRLEPAHWPAVARIFEEGIETGQATFETEVPTWPAWDRAHLADDRLVAVADGTVLGWAALSPCSGRPVYAGVAEDSVYITAGARRRGVGRLLLTALVEQAEEHGIWTVEAGMFRENAASIALHHACGFRTVGVRERLGRTGAGAWRDVVLLERRSARVG